jgi:hypothetical protein
MVDGPCPLRGGAVNDELAGPLGSSWLSRLADPLHSVVLKAWFDANG